MKHKHLSLLTASLFLTISACSVKLSPHEVSDSFWVQNISQGGLFSPSFNFTLTRNYYENDELVSTGTVKNDNGKIHIELQEYTGLFEIIDSGSFYSYYESTEEGGWVKEKYKSMSSLQAIVLECTILYPFEFEPFTYNKVTDTYQCFNYNSEDWQGKDDTYHVTFDFVEFTFYNDKISSCIIMDGETKVELISSSEGTTRVELPNAIELDNSNPYWYTRHKISNVQIGTSPYAETIRNELSNAYLYVVGDDLSATQVQIVNFVSDGISIVYHCANAGDYQRSTRSFDFEFGKRQGEGPDYDPFPDNADESRRIEFSYACVENDTLTIDFTIPLDDKGEQVATINTSSTLTNQETITSEYRYPHKEEQLRDSLQEKQILFTNVLQSGDDPNNGPDVFTNGYFVTKYDNNDYVEMHLNNNKVALGYLDLTSYSDTTFRLRFEAEYDIIRNEIKSLSYSSGEATATNGVFTITINYKNSYYRATLVITDTPATVQYTSYMQDKEQVSEATWNKYFKNHDFDNSEGFIACFNNATEFKYITYKDNKVKITSGTHGSESTTLYYYKDKDSTSWKFIYLKEGYGWVETNDGTFNMDKLYRMCLFDLNLEFSAAQFWENYYWMYNVKSYEKAHFFFQYQTLERIELYQQIGDTPEVVEYRFTDISDIEFPEIDNRF